MKNSSNMKSMILLLTGLAFSASTLGASVDLANAPLDKATTGDVKPNILFVLDDSGSMVFTYLPDEAGRYGTDGNGFASSYGYLSSQCNGVYYDPNVTYNPPPTKNSTLAVPEYYPNAVFTAAKDDGFDTSATPTVRNLNNDFTANRFVPEAANSDYRGFGSYIGTTINTSRAVYYQYNGTVTDKDYNVGSAFYNECDTTYGDATVGNTLTYGTLGLGAAAPFTRVRLSTEEVTFVQITDTNNGDRVSSITVNGVELMSSGYRAGGSDNDASMASNVAAKITRNGFSAVALGGGWMSITGPTSAAGHYPVINGTGLNFKTEVFPYTDADQLTNFANWYSFYRTRMLMMKSAAGDAFNSINQENRLGLMKINSSTPTVYQGTFSGANRESWFEELYATGYSTGGTPLREALSTAGRYYAGSLAGVDPVQYSCQQNFTILSSDGYWNDNDSDAVKLNGTTKVGNQDGTSERPYFDGLTSAFTHTYARTRYSATTRGCNGSRRGQSREIEQRQIGTCQSTSAAGGCTPSNWYDSGRRRRSGCQRNLVLPSPNPSNPSNTPISSVANMTGGSDNSLADVAMYYYKTDIRDGGNCTGGPDEEGNQTDDVCFNGDVNGVGGVFSTPRDNKKEQHMTTYTLGLANGNMKYVANYESTPGDFLGIRDGLPATSTLCSWLTAGETCNWPVPSREAPSTIDDLWHAAVNGRGAYFNANNPDTLSTGIRSALVGIVDTKGAASASSSSSLSPSPGDNASFVASYSTNTWQGNLEARSINLDTGERTSSATWCVESIVRDSNDCAGAVVQQSTGGTTILNCETPETTACEDGGGIIGPSGNATSGVNVCKTEIANSCTGTFTTTRDNPLFSNAVVSDDTDSRTIKTASNVIVDTDTGETAFQLVDFDSAFTTANPTHFNAATLSGLTQWSNLDTTQQTNAVARIAGYIRGQYGFDTDDTNFIPADVVAGTPAVDNRLFRRRDSILGDILESKPTYNGKSRFNYGYPGYSSFKATQNAKSAVANGIVYAGANDGMLHAFVANTGAESWAYIPSMAIPNLWKLADNEYRGDDKHVNFVNGEVSIADVCTANCESTSNAVWKTILVGGLNAGGRGYYALDITNPTSPALLWEFTTANGIGSTKDNDLGFSFAKPVIARKANNTWVVLVTSGYNNESPGSGDNYLFALNAGTGEIVSKIATPTGSGLGRIQAWNDNPKGNEVGDVYGGDLSGNIWKFDINSEASAAIGKGAVSLFTQLTDAGGNPQPITTTPLLASKGQRRLVIVATGQLLEDDDNSSTGQQSIYAITDDNSGPLTDLRQNLVEQTITTNLTADRRTVTTPATVNLAEKRGWFVDFPTATNASERVVKEGILTQGVLYFISYIPGSSACSPGGDGWFNYFDYATGAPIAGFSGEKMPTAGAGLSYTYGADGGVNVDVTFTDGRNKLMGPTTTGEVGSFTGKRTLWRELIE